MNPKPVVVPPMDTTPAALAKLVLRHRPNPPDTQLAEELTAEYGAEEPTERSGSS